MTPAERSFLTSALEILGGAIADAFLDCAICETDAEG